VGPKSRQAARTPDRREGGQLIWRLGGLLLLSLATAACERGCARHWLQEHGSGEPPSSGKGSLPLNAIDCPDGLARCSGGVVQASRLARLPQPCQGRPEQCTCPWDRVAECEAQCVVDDLELVVPRESAARQLCAPGPDAGVLTGRPLSGEAVPGCEEGQLYRCVAGAVVACHENAIAATCVHGCVEQGAFIDDDEPVQREAAFAILCSR
jgi:hypothetical protein